MNGNKTGLTIFIICLIVAIAGFFMGYSYVAIGFALVGLVSLFIPGKKQEEEPPTAPEPEAEEELVDEIAIATLVNNLFTNIDDYRQTKFTSVDALLAAQQKILGNLEELNEYEPSLLAKVYPEFHGKLANLSTNWIKIKEDYKEIPDELFTSTIDGGFEQITTGENTDFPMVQKYIEDVLNNELLPLAVKNYAKEKFEAYESSTCGISSEVQGEPAVDFEQIKAPTEVMDLSWYLDGPLANFPKADVALEEVQNHFQYKIIMTKEESSLISVCDKIIAADKLSSNVKNDLVYATMTPVERGEYLYWLNNLDSQGEGYALLFLRSIQRHICLDEDNTNAFNMLLKLYEIFAPNKELANEIFNLLILCTIKNNSKEMASKLLSLSGNKIGNVVLSVAAIVGLPLSIDHIYALANSVGFTNKRYMRLYPEMFTDVLRQILYKNYNMEKFPLQESNFSQDKIIITINNNPAMTTGQLEMDTFLLSNDLKDTIKNLLVETHETIKETLREQRKNKTKE